MRVYGAESRWANCGHHWPISFFVSIGWWELGLRLRRGAVRLDLGWRLVIFDWGKP